MSKRVGITDLAKAAGVSTATVDRVLHGRGSYSAKSERLVRQAIDELGYGTLGAHITSARKEVLEFQIYVPSLPSVFQQTIEDSARTAAAAIPDFHINLNVGYLKLEGGACTIAALRAVDPEQTDAICLFAVDAPGVRDEIDRLVSDGVKVCTIVSDVPSSNRFAYIGLDNVAAGRTAGRMIAAMAPPGPGRVGVLTGSNQIRDHLERYMGLSQALTLYRPELRVLPACEGFSFNDKHAEMTRALLQDHEDLSALYSIAGGSLGMIEGLRTAGKPEGMVAVLHELEPGVREAMLDGTIDLVLHQDPRNMLRIAIGTMVNACRGRPPLKERLPIEIYVAENLP